MMIKDTRVNLTYQLKVSLTEDVPEISGFGPELDPVAFQPTYLEIMWLKMNGQDWELQSVRAKRNEGYNTFYRTIQSYRVGSFPWIADIVLETRPDTPL